MNYLFFPFSKFYSYFGTLLVSSGTVGVTCSVPWVVHLYWLMWQMWPITSYNLTLSATIILYFNIISSDPKTDLVTKLVTSNNLLYFKKEEFFMNRIILFSPQRMFRLLSHATLEQLLYSLHGSYATALHPTNSASTCRAITPPLKI